MRCQTLEFILLFQTDTHGDKYKTKITNTRSSLKIFQVGPDFCNWFVTEISLWIEGFDFENGRETTSSNHAGKFQSFENIKASGSNQTKFTYCKKCWPFWKCRYISIVDWYKPIKIQVQCQRRFWPGDTLCCLDCNSKDITTNAIIWISTWNIHSQTKMLSFFINLSI